MACHWVGVVSLFGVQGIMILPTYDGKSIPVTEEQFKTNIILQDQFSSMRKGFLSDTFQKLCRPESFTLTIMHMPSVGPFCGK
jgi:hypothetical protein